MKKNVLFVLLVILIASSCVYLRYEGVPPSWEDETSYEAYPAQIDVGYFYDYLSPYGIWVYERPYGYVWIPGRVSYLWRPYTYGRWIWTDYGWTWISHFEWGWIPFHYGRWGWDRHLGWFWVPGTLWGPAWVTWRWSNYHIGWAPLPPGVEFVFGVGIRGHSFDLPGHSWVFIEGNYFFHDRLDRYVLPPERNSSIIRYSVSATNLADHNRRVVNEGIDRDQIRRVTRNEVRKFQLEEAKKPGRTRVEADTLQVYKPEVTGTKAAKPRSSVSAEEAQERLPEIKREGLEEKAAPGEVERRLKEEQEREIRLLEKSQEKEAEEMRLRVEEEKRKAVGPEEKQKVEKDSQVKAQELEKKHAEEKAKIDERHKEEKKQVDKKKLKKKD